MGADHSVLRLLQISQQHIDSQLERAKHERELWKEVVERRQQQHLQLALSMREHPAGPGNALSSCLPPAPQSARGCSSLKDGIRQKQQEALENTGAVEQQAEMCSV